MMTILTIGNGHTVRTEEFGPQTFDYTYLTNFFSDKKNEYNFLILFLQKCHVWVNGFISILLFRAYNSVTYTRYHDEVGS